MSLGSITTGTDSDAVLEIQQILGKKTFRGKTYYKVKWYGNDGTSWELSKNCHCQQLIDQYESDAMLVGGDEDEDEWEVQEILEKRVRRKKVEYLVKWKGWPGEPTWELADNCQCINLIAAFENPQLKKMWDFEGHNKNLWLDRRTMHRFMRRYIDGHDCPVNLLRFLNDFPPDEQPLRLKDGLNIGPLCYEGHWYIVIFLINHICVTRHILVGDALNTLIGTNKKDHHPVIKRLKKVYPRFTIKPISMTQMDRSDICAYYILACFERAIFLLRQEACFVVDSIFFDSIRAELIRSKIRPETNNETSVSLPIPEAFDIEFVCEFCKKQFQSRKMVDNHIKDTHFENDDITVD